MYRAHNFLSAGFDDLFFQVFFPLYRQAEINEFEVNWLSLGSFAQKKKILRLKISVSNFLPMAVLHCSEHLQEDGAGFFLGQVAFLLQVVEELAAITVTWINMKNTRSRSIRYWHLHMSRING